MLQQIKFLKLKKIINVLRLKETYSADTMLLIPCTAVSLYSKKEQEIFHYPLGDTETKTNSR